MAIRVGSSEETSTQSSLGADFTDRLEGSLDVADIERRRRERMARLVAALPVLLLVGPVVMWKLTSATPGGEHVAVDALVSLTLVLDAGIHVNTAVLSYLHLEALPFVVGALLLTLSALWLMWEEPEA
jgi:hypothetical protein